MKRYISFFLLNILFILLAPSAIFGGDEWFDVPVFDWEYTKRMPSEWRLSGTSSGNDDIPSATPSVMPGDSGRIVWLPELLSGGQYYLGFTVALRVNASDATESKLWELATSTAEKMKLLQEKTWEEKRIKAELKIGYSFHRKQGKHPTQNDTAVVVTLRTVEHHDVITQLLILRLSFNPLDNSWYSTSDMFYVYYK